MPTTGTVTGGVDNLIKRQIPGFSQPVQVDGPRPEKAAAPFALGPGEVWGDKYTVPVEGGQPRVVNTAIVDAGDQEKISMDELKALGQMLTEVPREFFQRLLAASYNKDPQTGKIVGVDYTKPLPTEYGDVTVSFKALKGRVTTDVNIVIKDPELDNWVKDYLAAQPRDEGKHTVVDLHAEGELKLSGGVDNINLKGSIAGLPYLSLNKIFYSDAEKQLGYAVEGQAPDGADDAAKKAQDEKEKKAALDVFKSTLGYLGAFKAIIDEVKKDSPFKLTYENDEVSAILNGGKMAFVARALDVFRSAKNRDEAHINAEAKGGVSRRGDEDVLGVSEIVAKNADRVHIRFEDGEDGKQKPIFEMSHGRRGERVKLKDYAEVGEGFISIIAGILAGEKPF
jgi:hypothetical protein